MTDTNKYQASVNPALACWQVEDRTDVRHWFVTFSRLGEPHIVNGRTGRSLNPHSLTALPIVNAVRRALENEITS